VLDYPLAYGIIIVLWCQCSSRY